MHDVSDLGYDYGMAEISELNSNQRSSSHLVVGPMSCRVCLGSRNSLAFDTSQLWQYQGAWESSVTDICLSCPHPPSFYIYLIHSETFWALGYSFLCLNDIVRLGLGLYSEEGMQLGTWSFLKMRNGRRKHVQDRCRRKVDNPDARACKWLNWNECI